MSEGDHNPRPSKRARRDLTSGGSMSSSLTALPSSPTTPRAKLSITNVDGSGGNDGDASVEAEHAIHLTPLSDLTASTPNNSQISSSQPHSSTHQPKLKTLPPSALLNTLPGLLIHPPNHKSYVLSLVLSLNALRKCLALQALSPEAECRAWMGLAEVGMRVVAGGLSKDEEHPWARGIETEVDKALSKGSLIAQKHPSLRPFRHHFSLLQAQFSHWQNRTKFARTLIRNLISSFQPVDPPYIVYSAHLAAISLYIQPAATPNSDLVPNSLSALTPSSHLTSAQDTRAALLAVQTMESLSVQKGHPKVTLLAQVLRLRILVAASKWAEVPPALQHVEAALGLSYQSAATPVPRQKPKDGGGTPTPDVPCTPAAGNASGNGSSQGKETTFITFKDPFEAAMVVHVLTMAVAYFAHAGFAAEVSPRLSHLHALLDSGVLEKFEEGIVRVEFGGSPPLIVQVTHSRVLFLLTFLLSSVARRDVTGRKPKRKVFASEGLTTWDNEVDSDLYLPSWASLGDLDEIEQGLARVKADLMCELVAVSIMRSEFGEAERHLSILIAHTRTHNIFTSFSARITLHHAHLAHALGHTTRAVQCYSVAAQLAEDGSFVNVSARAGRALLKVGLGQAEPGTTDRDERTERKEVIKACKGIGGTLETVGHVLEACTVTEILKSKLHLKSALTLATQSQDNHLRALILALISSQYFYTAEDHAQQVLQTCEQLAAGLGAPATKPKPSPSQNHSQDSSQEGGQETPPVLGNVPLGLWVGERFLELYQRAGKTAKVQKQAAANAQYSKALVALKERGMVIGADIGG